MNETMVNDPKALYHQAIELFKANQVEKSAELLEEALAIQSENPDILEALGVIYGKLNRLDEAIGLMKTLARVEPDSVMAHTNLSQFYVRKGMIPEAEQEQAEARRLSWKAELRAKKISDSEIEKITLEESKTEAALIQKKIEQYKKVIEYDPKDVLGYFSLGTVYLQARRFQEAAEAFQKAVEVGPDHSPSYVGFGEVLEALGKKEEAIQIYRRGIPVADQKGDIVPLRKMESRLRKLSSPDPQ